MQQHVAEREQITVLTEKGLKQRFNPFFFK